MGSRISTELHFVSYILSPLSWKVRGKLFFRFTVGYELWRLAGVADNLANENE